MPDLTKYSTTTKVWALREFGRIGPRAFRALIARFGDIDTILEADFEDLEKIDGMETEEVELISQTDRYLDEAEQFIDAMNIRDIGTTNPADKKYPDLLRELNDPPIVIFHRGKLPSQNEKRCAFVGTIEATTEGIAATVELSGRLAEKKIGIVSGLARGIDSAAHIGAVNAGGKSHAVLGTGFDHIFPEENRPLAIELAAKGALISEYPPDTEFSEELEFDRNRLIVGLSQAVLIGELTGDSKRTLDIAASCHELGKLMFILIEGIERPGRDNSGVEEVLKLGAIPVSLKDALDLIPKSLV